jgi:hypothetical protein
VSEHGRGDACAVRRSFGNTLGGGERHPERSRRSREGSGMLGRVRELVGERTWRRQRQARHGMTAAPRRRGRERGRGVLGEDDGEEKLLDTTRHAKPTSRGGARAGKRGARVHGMPGQRSPCGHGIATPHSMPNDVQWVVPPSYSLMEVIDRLEELCLDGSGHCKFAVANLITFL